MQGATAQEGRVMRRAPPFKGQVTEQGLVNDRGDGAGFGQKTEATEQGLVKGAGWSRTGDGAGSKDSICRVWSKTEVTEQGQRQR